MANKGNWIDVWISNAEILAVASLVAKTKENTRRAADRHAKNMADRVNAVLRANTPIYQGHGQGNVPGTLMSNWEVQKEGVCHYRLYPTGESKAGTNWSIPYLDVVGFLVYGVGVHTVFPRGRANGGADALWWYTLPRPVAMAHPFTPQNDFLSRSVDHAHSYIEDTGRAYIFEIMSDLHFK